MLSFGLNFRCAVQSLIEQRQRAVLSATGIMVGCLAIVLLVSIAKGVQKDVSGQVNQLGVNVLVVIPGRVTQGEMFNPNIAGLSYLRDEDVDRVRKIPGVKTAAPLMFAGGAITNGDRYSPTTIVLAAGPEWFTVHPVKMAEGAVYGHEDEPVCVIGSIAKKNLFGEGSALGKKVDINGESFKVIGVTENKESEHSLFSVGSFENVAYFPYIHARKHLANPQLHRIMIQTQPDLEPKKLVSAVEAALAERLPESTFSVLTQEDLLNLVFKIMGILTWLLTGLTSIALFVGGVGIMTVMLMSVNERSAEIGIRKTVGARRRDIFQQFLVESVLLALLGGFAGFVLSWVVDTLLDRLTPIKPELSPAIVALAFGVSLGVGAVFGLIPAMRAARKDPVVALRTSG